MRLGYDPADLYPKSRDDFIHTNLNSEVLASTNKGFKLTDEMIDIKFNYFERKRIDRINEVKNERKQIIYFQESKMNLPNIKGNNTKVEEMRNSALQRSNQMVEAEARRLEALKKRQEAEIEKLIEKEKNIAELQLKIQRAEQEEKKRKIEHDRKVALQRQEEEKRKKAHELELKVIEEEEIRRIKEIKIKESKKERDMVKQRQKEEIQRKKKAIERDLESRRVVEERQQKTATVIQQQIELAERNRKKMIEKEEKVMKQLEEKKFVKKKEIETQKEEATKRIEAALQTYHQVQIQKKIDFDKKQEEVMQRTIEKEKEEEKLLRKRLEDNDKKESDRIRRLVENYRDRLRHRSSIIEYGNARANGYDKIRQEREQKIALLKFSTILKQEDRLDNVKKIQRMNEFRRLQIMKRIELDDMRYEQIISEKDEMLKKHLEEQRESMIRKHIVSETMEKMRVTNDFSLLSKLNFKDIKKSNNHTTSAGGMGEIIDDQEFRPDTK